MQTSRFFTLALALTLSAGVSPRARAQEVSAAPDAASKSENAQQALVYEAAQRANDGKPDEALQSVDEAIAGYEARYGESKERIYAARTLVETLLYMADAGKSGGNATAVEPEFGYAYYFRGYVLIELGRTREALAPLQRAVELSPWNSQFLSEIGNYFQSAKNWPEALANYKKAESASEFSPDDLKQAELGRALRGQGFVLIEQGRYDEAEALYMRCLKLDETDEIATRELAYAREQRAARRKNR